MDICEKIAYIDGLTEGLDLDKTTKEGKILAAVIDLLKDITEEICDIEDACDDMMDTADGIANDTVDAAQGIEAQTLANVYLALDNDLEIIPVINKIDLPNADIPKRIEELTTTLGFKEEDIVLCSAKTGEGVKEILDKIVEVIPQPKEPDTHKDLC